MIPKAQSMKEMSTKADFVTMKNFHSSINNAKKIRRNATEWEEIFAKDTSDQGVLPKTQKEFLELNKKKTTNLAEKMSHRPSHTPHQRRHTDGK